MHAEILAIINKNLPAEVGEALKLRLITADQEALRLKDALGAIESLKAENTALTRKVREGDEIRARIDALNKGEAKLLEKQVAIDKAEAVLAVRVEMVKDMIAQNKEVVLAVFGNNKMKYQENRMDGVAFAVAPSQFNSCPCPQTTTTQSSKQVEVTGG